MEHDRQMFLLYWAIFLPFTSLTTWKNQNFQKTKKTGISSFYTCERQMKIIWCMVPETWSTTIFWLFTLIPLTTWKIKILKKWKKCPEISSFYTCVPKLMIICYTVPEIWRVMDVISIFHFGIFFALLPNNPKNQNFEKMKKTPGDIITLHMCTNQKLWSNNVHFLWNGMRQMNGWAEKVT